jgi:hypothetical protein
VDVLAARSKPARVEERWPAHPEGKPSLLGHSVARHSPAMVVQWRAHRREEGRHG